VPTTVTVKPSVSAVSVSRSDARTRPAVPVTDPRDDRQVPAPGSVLEPIPEPIQREVSRRFQEAAVGHLVLQLRRALRRLNSGGSALAPGGTSGWDPREGLEEGRSKESEREDEGLEKDERSERSERSERESRGIRIKGLVVSGGVACNHYLRER
jgi:tRNA A37 threonylcarbamoyltransferase TsaD